MDDLAPVPTQPTADHDRNQPDHLVLTRKRGREKKVRSRSSQEEAVEIPPEEGHQLDVLA